jgi:hypothetical protein
LREARLFGDIGELGQKWTAGRLTPWLRLHSTRRNSLSESSAGYSCHGRASRARYCDNHFASRDHWAGSTAFSIWFAFTFSNLCTIPEGQRISTSFAVESSPKPAITRLSLAERYPTAVLTVKY